MKMLHLISSVLLAITLAFIGTSTVLAAWGGGINARDRADGGWIGDDDPDGVRRPHGPDSVWQELSLAEWDEPSHDWVYDRWNRWGQAATALFNAEWQVKGLGTQLRIVDGNNYFIDYRFDSEKTAIAGSPTLNSDLEWCNNFFLGCDPIDRTGMMRKVALVQ